MNNFEKLENAIGLGPVTKKQDILVYGQMGGYAAAAAGMTQKELFEGNEKWIEACNRCYAKLDCEPQMVFPIGPYDIVFAEQMRVRIPGRELGDNELFQLIEEENMSVDDYSFILEHGLAAWQMPHIASIQTPPIPRDEHMFEAVGKKFQELGMHIGQNTAYWAQRGIPTGFQNSCFPAFDLFSLARRMENFVFDLFDEGELVKKACDAATKDIIQTTLANSRPGSLICLFAMRSSQTFVSPDIFEEFCWPNMKLMVEEFCAKGMIPVIHCDANWELIIPFFRELPKGRCIIELDGDTDIVKAKEILGGYQCIAGDVPATLFAFDTVQAVQKYCDMLIDLAMDGGFIIRNGCEIPLNAKDENVKVFLDCCR